MQQSEGAAVQDQVVGLCGCLPLLADMGAAAIGQGVHLAVHAHQHAAGLTDHPALVRKANVMHHHALLVRAAQLGQPMGAQPHPQGGITLAAPFGAQRLGQHTVAHADDGHGLFLQRPVFHPFVAQPQAAQQAAQHVADGVCQRHHHVAVSLAQHLGYRGFAGAGRADQADQRGKCWGGVHRSNAFNG